MTSNKEDKNPSNVIIYLSELFSTSDERLRNINLANFEVPIEFTIGNIYQLSHNTDHEQTLSLSIKRKVDDKIYYTYYYVNDMKNSELSPNYPKSILQNVNPKYLMGFLYLNKEKAIVLLKSLSSTLYKIL